MKDVKTGSELLVEECRAARQMFERAEVDYLAFLQNVEKTRRSDWHLGWGTFKSFLEEAVGLPRVSRYSEFCEAVASLGLQRVRAMGVDAAVMSLRASTPVKQEAYEAAVAAWVTAHDGVHPHGDTPKKLLRQVDPREEEPQAVGKMRELETLRKENVELRKKVHALEREREKLLAQLAKRTDATSKPKGQKAAQPRA